MVTVAKIWNATLAEEDYTRSILLRDEATGEEHLAEPHEIPDYDRLDEGDNVEIGRAHV